MAELKRTFSTGVINKDLDERLLPSGQYRDALNVQVSTSEGSDVGALQNILGSKLPYATSIAANLGADPYVLGSIRKDETECVYWFVKSATKNLVIEYNQKERTVSPVIVDTNSVLAFDRKNLITGVEILDDFLIWTDNSTEPKMIIISEWRDLYSNGSWNHTQVNGGDFEEKHCTVIKENPKYAPNIRMSKTTRSGPVSATLTNRPTVYNEEGGYSFTYLDPQTNRWLPVANGEYTNQNGDGVDDTDYGVAVPIPDPRQSQILVSGPAPDFREGDKLKITLINKQGEEDENDAAVIVSVTQVYASNPKLFKINIDSVSENIEQNRQNWKIELIQKPALFEKKFPRFAYRYKYKDGQYSAISPFSETAFLGDTFDYEFSKGYNLGMVNQLRKLEIVDWARTDSTPYGVDEVEILYKDSSSNNIYIVKGVKTTDVEYTDIGSYPDIYFGKLEITSELIYKVIPSNQILRPYDNVPRRAKAVSVSGNRLMFGNYIENYNIKKHKNDSKDISIKFAINIIGSDNTSKEPKKSLKSQRTYQIGVVYRDKYGRETPVFTDNTGSFKLNKGFAKTRNTILARIISPMPFWAESFKYYIKETSQPYYNLAMDRSYKAEDGNLWVSFSSSDRNKINEETFLELKKNHDSDKFVEAEAKYKVLAIDNEAPDFIKEENVSKGVISRSIVSGSTASGGIFGTDEGYPLSANKFIDIIAEDWQKVFGGKGDQVTSATPVHQLNDLNLIMFNDENSTRRYDITTIQYFSHYNPAVYRINLDKPFDSDDIQFVKPFSQENSTPTLSIEIFQKEIKRKPEYKGRFFTKLQRNEILERAIVLEENSEANLRVTASQPFFCMSNDPTGPVMSSSFYAGMTAKNSPDNTTPGWFIDNHKYFYVHSSDGPANTYPGGKRDNFRRWGVKVDRNYMDISWHNVGNETDTMDKAVDEMRKFASGAFVDKRYFPEQTALYAGLTKVGTRFWFEDDPNKEENIYTIVSYVRSYVIPYEANGRRLWKNGKEPNNRIINIGLILDKKIKWSPEGKGFDYDGSGNKPNKSRIQIVEIKYDEKEVNPTDNPAVFETEPLETAELDIYYEASGALSKDSHGGPNGLNYSNCYCFGNGVESDRIRDDFNAPILGKGVRVSTVIEEQYKEVVKKSDIIYSGIYNSTSGINNLNQFIQAEQITKAINPSYGSIQLMEFRLGDLDVYLEDNIVKVLADRDALFNADGSRNVVSSTNVLGSIQPYAGDYGISKNPESYARYGNRAYFSDKNRGVILRLSGNGLTPISNYGMEDYFRDKLSVSDIDVIGSYDENKDEYNITLSASSDSKDNKGNSISLSKYNDTVSFKENVNGWNSRKSFIQEDGLSLNNVYYTFKNGEIWSHDNETRNNFYGVQYESSVKFIFNDAPGSVKSFKTLNYEGSQARVFVDNPDTDNKFKNRLAKSGWWVDSIESDLQSGQVKTFKNKEGKWFYNILGTETTDLNLDTKEYSVQGLGYISAITGSQGEDIEIIVQ